MIYLDLLRLILADFKRRKLSTFLTFFSISLGILAIFVIVLVSVGFENSIAKQFEQFGSNRVYVAPSDSKFGTSNTKRNFTDFEVGLIKNQPYVKEVYPYYFNKFQLKFGSEFKSSRVIGLNLNKQYFEDLNLKLAKGRYAKSNEKYSILMGPTAAVELFQKDIIIGSNIYVKGVKFKVVGILESIGNPEDDKQIYFNINTLRDLSGAGNHVSVADILINNGVDMDIAKENLKITLEKRLGRDSIMVITPQQILEQLGSIIDIVKYTLGGIGLVALIIGALGIINTMHVIVTEKIRDIGIMKSIGATNSQILSLFIMQAGLFGFFGAVLGVFLGGLVGILFEKLASVFGFSMLIITIDPQLVFFLLIFGFLVGILAGFMPSYKASRLNIIDAIRK